MVRHNRIPKLTHHKASGQAVVRLNDVDHYLGVFGTDVARRAYDQLINQWLANDRRLPSERNGQRPLTVDDIIIGYLEFAKGYYIKDGRPTTEQQTLRSALRPLHELYGMTAAGEFSPLKLKSVREKMIQLDWCRDHINKQVSRIKSMFRWAVENELVEPAVHQGLLAVKGLKSGRTTARESKRVRPVPDEQIDAIKNHVSKVIWTMIELQRCTGMRSGEVVIMRSMDIDRSESVWAYRPASHKTEHHGIERVVYLGPKAQSLLIPYLSADGAKYLFNPVEMARERLKRNSRNRRKKRIKDRAVPPCDHYSSCSYRRAIARGCERAGITTWHPHQLRHNAATAIRKSHGLEAARIILGHRSAAVTQIYAEVDCDRARKIVGERG